MEIIIIGTTFLKKEEAVKSNIFLSTLLVGIALLVQSCATTATIQGNLSDLKPVLGEWVRPPGGYRLLVKEVDGRIKVKYINPSQGNINVSQSKIGIDDKKIEIEVTLSDVNYPGSHYALMYDEKADTLKGKYTNPQGTYDVTFVREASNITKPTKAIPLPHDMKIVPADPGLPPEIKNFSGKWKGTWDSGRDCILIVEEIDNQKAKVIYAWGYVSGSEAKPGFTRNIAKVDPGPPVRIEFVSRIKFVFEMQKDSKSLKGRWETSESYGRVTMKRVTE